MIQFGHVSRRNKRREQVTQELEIIVLEQNNKDSQAKFLHETKKVYKEKL